MTQWLSGRRRQEQKEAACDFRNKRRRRKVAREKASRKKRTLKNHLVKNSNTSMSSNSAAVAGTSQPGTKWWRVNIPIGATERMVKDRYIGWAKSLRDGTGAHIVNVKTISDEVAVIKMNRKKNKNTGFYFNCPSKTAEVLWDRKQYTGIEWCTGPLPTSISIFDPREFTIDLVLGIPVTVDEPTACSTYVWPAAHDGMTWGVGRDVCGRLVEVIEEHKEKDNPGQLEVLKESFKLALSFSENGTPPTGKFGRMRGFGEVKRTAASLLNIAYLLETSGNSSAFHTYYLLEDDGTGQPRRRTHMEDGGRVSDMLFIRRSGTKIIINLCTKVPIGHLIGGPLVHHRLRPIHRVDDFSSPEVRSSFFHHSRMALLSSFIFRNIGRRAPSHNDRDRYTLLVCNIYNRYKHSQGKNRSHQSYANSMMQLIWTVIRYILCVKQTFAPSDPPYGTRGHLNTLLVGGSNRDELPVPNQEMMDEFLAVSIDQEEVKTFENLSHIVLPAENTGCPGDYKHLKMDSTTVGYGVYKWPPEEEFLQIVSDIAFDWLTQTFPYF